jgi:hypothetical protein
VIIFDAVGEEEVDCFAGDFPPSAMELVYKQMIRFEKNNNRM